MAKIGYARVSTRDQKLDSQIDMLKARGCHRIFSEKASGRKVNRTELDKCLDYLREGDTLVIFKLDRLGRTTKQLVELSQYFEDNKINLEILDMKINTNDAFGKMFFQLMSAFAELEANLLSERTKRGLESARARGHYGGRRGMSEEKKEYIKMLYDSKKYSMKEIAEKNNIHPSTVWRVVNNKSYKKTRES